ncbi:FUSC family protein [Pseudidiomarina terrestris]|uniref:FUSC family protein n=1 Tax=Pseudidiomarina terrestris TaxID=2820060 RepID=UPI002657BA10|nr:FUSC family protein [Pseudidiomarina sp. 1APR75-33.1]
MLQETAQSRYWWMNATTTKFAQFGFDYTRFRFGLRTGSAACLALFLAWALGLEHPQWAAMTVWSVSQPTRGLLLEKAGFRALGTIIGTSVGILIVLMTQDINLLAGLMLTFWVVACVYASTLLHGLISYGAVLAGYSASMVVLLTRTTDALVYIGVDRLVTVMLGILTALIIGWLFTYKRAEQTLVNKVRRQTAANLQLLAKAFDQGSIEKLPVHDHITQLAHLETQLNDHGSGSPSAHLSAKLFRRLLNAQLGIFAQLETLHFSGKSLTPYPELSEALKSCAQAIIDNDTKRMRATVIALRPFVAKTPIADAFFEFEQAATERLSFRESGAVAQSVRSPSLLLHRDWRGAKESALRTLAVMGLISILWAITGWMPLVFLLLGASVMLTLFSTAENPAKTMYYVFVGQAAGAFIAVSIQAFLWPHTDSILTMLLCLVPVVLLAGIPMSHNRTSPGSMDFVLVFLLLMQPNLHYQFDAVQSISIALAVTAAPLLAMASYKLVFPTNLRSRQRHLLQALERELQDIEQRKLTLQQLERYRARFYHRLFKLYQIADKLDFNAKLTAARWLLRVQQDLNKHEPS